MNESIVLVIGLTVIVALGYMMYSVYKQYKDMKLGEAMATLAVDNFETGIMIIIALCFVLEGMTAASAEKDASQGVAVITHTVLGLAGFMCTLTVVRDIVVIFAKKIPWSYRIWRIVAAILVLFLSFWVPLYTIEITSDYLGQYIEFTLWWKSFFISEPTYQQALMEWGYAPNTNIYAEFKPALKRSVGVTGLHFILTLMEAARNLSYKERRERIMSAIIKSDEGMRKDLSEKAAKDKGANKSPLGGEQRAAEKKKDNLTYVLNFTNIYKDDPDKVGNIVNMAVEVMEKMAQDRLFRYATKLAQFRTKVETLNSSLASPERKQKKAALRQEIRTFFESPIGDEDSSGLGLKLKGN